NGISKRTEQPGRRAFVWPNSVYNDGTGKLVPNTDVYTQTYGRLLWNSDLVTEVKSNYLANGAFWKLRELALNYDLPAHLFNGRFGSVVKGIAVGINGRNLLMFLPKSNQWTDPEFSASGNNAYTGNAVGRSTAFNMPPTRIFGANVAVRF
ncbi:MAG TPA: SusC/RagA family TonB-linked outer membrane protein, partial [Chitinophagaceae bacterium]